MDDYNPPVIANYRVEWEKNFQILQTYHITIFKTSNFQQQQIMSMQRKYGPFHKKK